MSRLNLLASNLFLSAFAFCTIGCSGGGGGSSAQDPGPSIKAAYQKKVDAVLMLLNYQSKLSDYDAGSHQMVSAKIEEIKNIVPLSGFSVAKQVDTLNLNGGGATGWEFQDSFAVRVDKVSIWYLSDIQTNIVYVDFKYGTYEVRSKALIEKAYVPETLNFDFASHPPQFVIVNPDVAVTTPKDLIQMSVGGGDKSPYSPRIVMEYSTFHPKTLQTINAWRTFLDDIDAELNDVQYKSSKSKNFPTAQRLNEIYAKLAAGFNALP